MQAIYLYLRSRHAAPLCAASFRIESVGAKHRPNSIVKTSPSFLWHEFTGREKDIVTWGTFVPKLLLFLKVFAFNYDFSCLFSISFILLHVHRGLSPREDSAGKHAKTNSWSLGQCTVDLKGMWPMHRVPSNPGEKKSGKE